MAPPPPEQVAARNAAAVLLGFGVVRAVRRARARRPKAKAKPASGEPGGGVTVVSAPGPAVDWEATRTALAAGLTSELFGRVSQLSGSGAVGGLASMLPVRMLCRERSMTFSYDFICAYVSAQVLIAAIPEWMRKSHVRMMMLSASQLLTAWILSDTTLPPHYIRFLYGQGKADHAMLCAYRKIYLSGEGKLGDVHDEERPLLWSWKTRDNNLQQKHGCGKGIVGFHKAAAHWFVKHMEGSVKFYLKVYLLRVVARLLSQGRGLMKDLAQMLTVSPTPQLRSGALFITDILRSSLFLSLYCTSAWYSIGMMGFLFPNRRASPAHLWLSLLIPGAAIALESPAQKTTIANYCATFALYPILAQSPYLFDAAFAVAMAACGSGAVGFRPTILALLWPQVPGQKRAAAAAQPAK